MRTPTESDWGTVDELNLDAECAHRQFSGKSAEEAEAMFRRNALYFQEDLLSMPAVPFNFYAPAFASYVASSAAKGDADGGSSFLAFVEELLLRQPALVQPRILGQLLEAADYVARNQAFYQADPQIYGDFLERLRPIQGLAQQLVGK